MIRIGLRLTATWTPACLLPFNEKVAALRKTDPIIDWSEVQIRLGSHRRASFWLSKVEGDQARLS